MIVPQNVINQIHRVEFSLFEPLSTTTLWAYPVGQSYDYRIFLSGQWTSVADDAGGSLSELIQRAELAIKAAVAATEGAENVNATLIGNTLTVTDREGKTTSITLSGTGGGGYEPPADGIPKTDLAVDVQTSLGKADTALQSFTESDPTVPSWAKQNSKPIYTAQEVGALPSDTPLFSGDYNDLSNKPTIPDAQIQSDWNQSNSSAKDFIKNKPTIPDVTNYVQKSQTAGLLKNDGSVDTNTYLTQHQDISGKQDKIDATHKLSADLVEDGQNNKSYTAAEKEKLGEIEAGAEVNVQANWNESNSSSDAYIQNKPNNLAYIDTTQGSATTANFDPQTDTVWTKTQTLSVASKTTARNNIGAQEALVSGTNIKTINNESVLGSGNISAEKPVAIEAPVNATDATLPVTALACEVGKYYRLDVAVETLAVTLPAMTDLTTVRTVVIYLTAGTTPAVTISSTAPSGGSAPDVLYQDGFEIEAVSTYEINALFNGAAWIVAGVKINTSNS